MAKLLLNLRNVPDDEADEVRALLDANGIAYYETTPGPWRISVGAIWVRDDRDHPAAKRLMAAYQAERGERAREAYAEAVREGRAETFLGQLRDEPMRVVLTIVAIVALLALVALPVILLRA